MSILNEYITYITTINSNQYKKLQKCNFHQSQITWFLRPNSDCDFGPSYFHFLLWFFTQSLLHVQVRHLFFKIHGVHAIKTYKNQDISKQ